MKPLALACLVLSVVLCVAGGCGDSSGTKSVHGKVTYRGAPLTNASIAFFPTTGRPETAALDESGQYEIALAPGEYQVTITTGLALPPGWKEGDPVPAPKIVLPAKYTNAAQTELTATVTEDASEPLDFRLE